MPGQDALVSDFIITITHNTKYTTEHLTLTVHLRTLVYQARTMYSKSGSGLPSEIYHQKTVV